VARERRSSALAILGRRETWKGKCWNMIRSPLGLRLNPSRPIRDQISEAARLGAKGVVIDAIGDVSPERLSETGRRELRHLLRSVELSLIGLNLPTRRAFDTLDQLDDRLRRAERAFSLAYELGTTLVLARVGALPAEAEPERREIFLSALRELGRRADHQGVRLVVETGTEPGDVLGALLESFDTGGLAASIDPATLLQHQIDPVAATRSLGPWVAHAYAVDPSTAPAGRIVTMPGTGSPTHGLDWENYLGALEEINYRGFLTVWPDPNRDPGPQFTAMSAFLSRF
jgi:L-ribulose-5-phosphate 3-epimerase